MNNEQDVVSIVVTIYNVAPYLEKCISSLLLQSYSNIEIILVNDGSSDASGDLCDKYKNKDDRIVVIHQPNKGFGPASNVGIDRATGKYLMFCDGDDYYFQTSVEHMVTAIKRTDADIAHAAGLAFDDATNSVLNEPYINTVSIPNKNDDDILLKKEIIEHFPSISVYCWTNIINLKWLRRNKIRWPILSIDYVDNPFHCNLMVNVRRLAIVREQICAHRMNRMGSAMNKVKTHQLFAALKISEKLIKKKYPEMLSSFYQMFFCDLFQYWPHNREVMNNIKETVRNVQKNNIDLNPQTIDACKKILKYGGAQYFIEKVVKFVTPLGIARRIYSKF